MTESNDTLDLMAASGAANPGRSDAEVLCSPTTSQHQGPWSCLARSTTVSPTRRPISQPASMSLLK